MDEKKDPVDILDEIMSRTEEPRPAIKEHPRFDPPEDIVPPPVTEAEKKTSNPAKRLLPWLCALLGGAVLAVLLLGFQLFSVNHRLEELQASLEEIQTVDELMDENEKLKNSAQNTKTDLQERYDTLEKNYQTVTEYNSDLTYRTAYQNALMYLEQFNRAGDWLMSGTLVEQLDPQFNPRNTDYQSDSGKFILPSQEARYLELREELFYKGGCMVIEGYTAGPDGSGYTERPYIAEGIYDTADLKAAKHLLTTLLYYPFNPEIPAAFLVEYFQLGSEQLQQLYVGAFQPSTATLFEQMRSDLLDQGYLEEKPDGTINIGAGLPKKTELDWGEEGPRSD